MTPCDSVGFIAAVLTSVAFLPQVLRVGRTRSSRNISLGMYGAVVAGVVCWVVYGVLVRAWPSILANLVTFLLAASVLLLKLRFDRAARAADHAPAGLPAAGACTE